MIFASRLQLGRSNRLVRICSFVQTEIAERVACNNRASTEKPSGDESYLAGSVQWTLSEKGGGGERDRERERERENQSLV